MSPTLSKAMSQNLSSSQLKTLCSAAIQAAQEAGQWIEKFDRRDLQAMFKDAGSSEASQIVTKVDIASEEIIRKRLQEISEPLNIGFVGEESSTSSSTANTSSENKWGNANERFEKQYFWCVDPLDGTLPFTEGRPGYAVSIALVEQSGKPLIGVVYDPAHQILLHAIKGQGSYRDLTPFSQIKDTANSLTVYADASFKTHKKYQSTVSALETCAHTLCLDGVTFIYGSGAVKNACHVFESSQACYLKLPKVEDGGGSIWDYAATACIAHEAGAWASNIYGHPLALNRPDSTFMNHEGVIFASNEKIAGYLIDAL
ncbi:MAG: 3'(2'), 5'-bisphosphate nucleotidase/myo-inositol-1(or 4)-monophosphatase [Pseudohongiellaceae bacterium]|jgi:3'(2'), 5'-bisphosphate nucleotidase/myo-inositol-1(or 4)-monophosphatase